MRFKGTLNLLFVVIIAASIVITLPVISFASTQAVNDAAANTKLTNIYNRLGNMYDRMAATNAYLSNIQTYTQNTQTYLQYIYGQLGAHTGYSGDIFMQVVGVKDMVQAVGGQVADVSSKLIYTNNYLSSLDSKIVNYTQYIDGIENSLNDFNNINWIDSGLTCTGVYSDVANNNAISYSSQYTGSDIYFTFDNVQASVLRNNNTYRFQIPLGAWNNIYRSNYYDNIEFLFGTTVLSGIEITSYLNKDNTFVIVTNSMLGYGTVPSQIHIHLTHPVYIYPQNFFKLEYIKTDTLDELLIKYYAKLDDININSYNSSNYLKRLTDVYASPDVIAAKEQQQAYEDQTISDFTGSGSAAASGSDATNMKNVSGAIKSGLDSGGSVSNVLGVFNTSGGLWDWFSQSNYDEINGPQTRTRGSEEYIDFYNTNREELERLLQEER